MTIHTKSLSSQTRSAGYFGPTRAKSSQTLTAGFTMIELCLALLIIGIISVMAVPMVTSAVNQYRLRSAVANATWAIQSTRFQSLMESYPFQVTIAGNATGNNPTYQIASQPPASGSFANVGGPVPILTAAAAINQPTVIQFKPNGTVTVTQNGSSATSFQISYQGYSNTISVSNYGNVSITTP